MREYDMRIDFNADGELDNRDWAMMRSHVLYTSNLTKHWLDVNLDGSVNKLDVSAVQSAITRQYDMRFDLNADGELSVADVRLVSMF
jgi:hypothetical protein